MILHIILKIIPEDWQAMIDREREQLRELFTNYGKIDQIFFDCSWCGLAWEEMKLMFKELRQTRNPIACFPIEGSVHMVILLALNHDP